MDMRLAVFDEISFTAYFCWKMLHLKVNKNEKMKVKLILNKFIIQTYLCTFLSMKRLVLKFCKEVKIVL